MISKLMGVINITPDSFSDGGKYNQIESFSNKMSELKNWADIIDIGAESTAPMNKKISAEEELNRFESILFPFLEKEPDLKKTISIDTYKIEVFKKVVQQINHYWPETKVIFNDVSGKIDDELIELLNDSSLIFDYIFSHNLCPSRDFTNRHMDYCNDLNESDFLRHIIDYFQHGLELLPESSRVLIDPCFGFSKTRQQNHFLIKNMKTFLLNIPYEVRCVYGVSKKSFLRFPKELDLSIKENLWQVEQMQAILIHDLIKESMEREIIFRVHNQSVYQSAMNVKNIFEV